MSSEPTPQQPIWARPRTAQARAVVTREQIAAAALRIADAEGFEAVSMRRVAPSSAPGR